MSSVSASKANVTKAITAWEAIKGKIPASLFQPVDAQAIGSLRGLEAYQGTVQRYLTQGEAQVVLQDLDPDECNYSQLVEALKRRYDRPYKTRATLHRQLQQLPVARNIGQDLRNTWFRISGILHGLRKYEDFRTVLPLLDLVKSKFPSEIQLIHLVVHAKEITTSFFVVSLRQFADSQGEIVPTTITIVIVHHVAIVIVHHVVTPRVVRPDNIDKHAARHEVAGLHHTLASNTSRLYSFSFSTNVVVLQTRYLQQNQALEYEDEADLVLLHTAPSNNIFASQNTFMSLMLVKGKEYNSASVQSKTSSSFPTPQHRSFIAAGVADRLVKRAQTNTSCPYRVWWSTHHESIWYRATYTG
uniref:Retrovirus-related Pol polyprotein from transposon TNT 1-94 n=1 Tax=Haemonchus placei TaxID=6290 RepID=A0A0N4VWE5_HAEPC